MRRTLLCLAVLCSVATSTWGGPNAGGTITLHWSSPIVYTPDAAWTVGGLTDCAGSVTQAPAATSFPNPPADQRQIWFAYAAFPEGSAPRLKAVTFGLSYNAFVSPVGVKIDWQAAPPGATEATTMSPAWPLPGSGDAIVFGTAMTGQVDQIYMFSGYGSPGQIFALRTHPTLGSQFADDNVPANLDDVADFGTLGFGVDGHRACPAASGACCFPDGSCQFLLEVGCAAAGGHWLGLGSNCAPNLCPSPPLGACCYADGHCAERTDAQCSTGDWRPGGACEPNPCPQPPSLGACCYADGHCTRLVEAQCSTGDWREGGLCTPNPCPQPPPSGACCYGDGHCTQVVEAQCTTGDWHSGSSCNPNPCPQPSGACCYADGHCVFVFLQNCPTGDWRIFQPCSPNPCSQPGQGPNREGTLIVHWNGEFAHSSQPDYHPGGLFACEDAVVQAPAPSVLPPPHDQCPVWFVYAVFPPASSPRLRGVEFGITYPPMSLSEGVSILWAAAPPNATQITTSSPPWPSNNSGTSLVFTQTMTGRLEQVYAFAGYGTPGRLFSLRSHPNHAGGFADDSVPARLDPIAAFGSLGFGVDGFLPCAGSSLPGACCYVDGACAVLLPDACADQGGMYLGGLSTCNPNPCPQPPSACCFPNGRCELRSDWVCVQMGGLYQGAGVPCEPDPCPSLGACCFPSGSCTELWESLCTNGVWSGGVPCSPNPCPQPPPVGACCYEDGHCARVLEAECTTGDWRSETPCVPNPCPQYPGACCYPDGHCVQSSGIQCGTGDWRLGVSCEPNPCPVPHGACCYPDESCEFTLQADCSTGDWRMGVPCTPNPCLPEALGACCYADGHCEYVPETTCQFGFWMSGVVCTPNPCAAPPPVGACCYADGHCTQLVEPQCPTGDWRLGVPCAPNPCPSPPSPCNAEPRRQVGPGAPVDALDRDFGNHAPKVEKGSYLGDNLSDTREGGEDFGSACVIPSLPFSDAGATCDNADNITLPCAASAAPDVVYSYTASWNGSINVTLCGSGYDTALGIYDMNQVNIACNDDFCGLQSEIDNINVTAGQTVYIVVDGFSTNCGSYFINVTENVAPPPLECPAGAQIEGEPDCHDGYYDSYNGGCGSTSWTTIFPQDGDHTVLCGKSGTYLYRGFSYRDTDWYLLEACGGQVCATWTSTFPIQAILFYVPDCYAPQYDLATGGPGQPVTLCRFLDGAFWLWAGPSQFNGVPCGSEYLLEVTGICGGPPPVPVETKSWGKIKYLFR